MLLIVGDLGSILHVLLLLLMLLLLLVELIDCIISGGGSRIGYREGEVIFDVSFFIFDVYFTRKSGAFHFLCLGFFVPLVFGFFDVVRAIYINAFGLEDIIERLG